jgi:hypothetical protein
MLLGALLPGQELADVQIVVEPDVLGVFQDVDPIIAQGGCEYFVMILLHSKPRAWGELAGI